MQCLFITHPEVLVDPALPVEDWPLSPQGRMRASLIAELVPRDVQVISSSERKARDTAAILAAALSVDVLEDAELGEMDRSATGYLPPVEFEPTVDAFFSHPHRSVRGWERAIDAQQRIERAVRRHTEAANSSVAFIAHGGVGALLMASLLRTDISRSLDQPGLGSWFVFDGQSWTIRSGWTPIA